MKLILPAIMNALSLLVAIGVASASSSLLLDEKCEVFEIPEGDVYNDFIHLSSLRNEKQHGEIFRYSFFYNYTRDDYLFSMFLTKASNLKDMDEQNNYWVLGMFFRSVFCVYYSSCF